MQLRCASLPFPLGLFALHYWFVVFEPGGACHRWEVWQRANAGGTSIGHVHCDLKPADAGVGGGPMRIAAEWTGEQALSIKRVLEAGNAYPYCHYYRYWPGPNSNTFAAWVLRRAGVAQELSWKAFGRDF